MVPTEYYIMSPLFSWDTRQGIRQNTLEMLQRHNFLQFVALDLVLRPSAKEIERGDLRKAFAKLWK